MLSLFEMLQPTRKIVRPHLSTPHRQKADLFQKVISLCISLWGVWTVIQLQTSHCHVQENSVEPTKPDMEDMVLELTYAERQYRQKLEVGKVVLTLVNSNDNLSEDSLTDQYKNALKLYRQSQVQHVLIYEHATLKPWQKEVLTFIQQATHWEVTRVVGQLWSEWKTFLQTCITRLTCDCHRHCYNHKRDCLFPLKVPTGVERHISVQSPLFYDRNCCL